MSEPDAPVGLIAGAGRLPVLTAEGVLDGRRRLVVAGLRGFASPRLEGLSDAFRWVGVAQLGRIIRHLKRNGCRKAVMIGSVRKADMHSRLRLLRYLPDRRTVRLWYRTIRHDRRDNAVLLAVTDELRREGIELMSSVEYCSEHLAEEGCMTARQPKPSVKGDVELGWRIATEAADLDIGQSLAVKEGDIIAVEAVEGTDAMIERTARLCPSGGWTMVKVARREQDMRFDVPTIGPDTVRLLAEHGCGCLVVEAHRTLLADKPATVQLADRLKLPILGKARASTLHHTVR